mmetsp:Transcript_11804/g.19186  ORF Transcript_11804/g.19186 Transcript_11804/m.19186 type:complete len:312 (-) Transcript_11804:319-1254(-)
MCDPIRLSELHQSLDLHVRLSEIHQDANFSGTHALSRAPRESVWPALSASDGRKVNVFRALSSDAPLSCPGNFRNSQDGVLVRTRSDKRFPSPLEEEDDDDDMAGCWSQPLPSTPREFIPRPCEGVCFPADVEPALPVVFPSPAHDLKFITSETMRDLLDGKFQNQMSRLLIVDCRFPYEYEGGHIAGAVNAWQPSCIEELLFANPAPEESMVIVFHCEFSIKRAPEMCRHLRNVDRKLHCQCYPNVYYPQIFVMEGGYQKFFENFKDRCKPEAYVPMKDTQFSCEYMVSVKSRRGMKKRSRSEIPLRKFY